MSYAHISKVEITNFRNFAKFTLSLQPTSVLLGANRVGKSNFLRALRLVLDPSLSDSQRILRAEDFPDHLESPFSGNVVEVKVFLRGFEGNTAAKSVLADCIVESDPLTACLTYQFRPRAGTSAGSLSESEYEFVVFGGNDEKNKVAVDVRRWLALMVLPALRDAETDLQAWRKSPLRPLLERARKLIPVEVLEEVRDKLDEANAPLLNDPAMTTLANAINERIRDLAGPLQHVETEFDFASSDPAQLLHAIRLFVTEAQTRSISDVSLGTNNILFLALLLQELESREAAKEVATSILAIEEPEAHLHPQLQRQIFRNFLRREHSVIVTTHSPSIASVAPLASIVLLRRVGSTKAFTTAGLKLTPEQVNDLQRYLDVTRAEILFARGIILVEGAAEQFLIPAFATKYLKEQGKGTSLDDYGIAVCSVNGTDFRPYHRLLSKDGLCVPHVIVTDADPRVMNDKIVIVGLRRGIQLIGEEGLRTELTQLITDGKSEQVVSDLRNEGIFVGDASLELDLVDEFANEMESTYSDLNTSEPARLRFKTAVEGARKGEQAESDEMMLRIERIGKGRFAQRLAEKVGAKQAPAYIKGAIEKIVSLVEENNA